ncbi:MAG: metal ABC transporter permease, partial [Deltaproteobacteria bacterium]|nr:metal ABC transporter permease [Deltaproteobacteria bacterium]
MFELFELLLAPFAACLIIAGLHCYMGIHIVQRGVIFVDLALAQVAVLGTTVGIMMGYEASSAGAYLFSLGFIIFGAVLFAISRFEDGRVPQEAIIGIVYVVSTAAAILLLDRTPHGLEEMKAMLVGSVLFVSWSMAGKTF